MPETIIYSTFGCSLLSLLGSILVLISYAIARTKTKPKAAQLIRNLAIADFLWFSCSLGESSFWIWGHDTIVPTWFCSLASPIVIFTRMSSLIWTCAVSCDVLLSVYFRKWLWRIEENDEGSQFNKCVPMRMRYYILVLIFSIPGALLNIIKQQNPEDQDLGCSYGYEQLGVWYEVFFTELLPIALGFMFNCCVFIMVRSRMSLKAFPQSVRKRRRQIMYHYIIVCIVCWAPTILFYITEISGIYVKYLELIARTTLYLTGFFNFIVYAMQDPHLKKSFSVLLSSVGLSTKRNVIIKDVDKTVMFQEATISGNADISKDKRSIYRYNKLSREDKQLLYADRPDLNPAEEKSGKSPLREPLLNFADQPSSPVKDNNINTRNVGTTPAEKQSKVVINSPLSSPPRVQSPADAILADAISISSPTHKSNAIPLKSNHFFGTESDRAGSESSINNTGSPKASSFVKAVAWLGGMEVIGPAPSGSVSLTVDNNDFNRGIGGDNNEIVISTNINDDEESGLMTMDDEESSDDDMDYEDEELSLST